MSNYETNKLIDNTAATTNGAVVEQQVEMYVDTRRNPKYIPGKFITSAKMDQEALECLYWFGCCCKTELAQASYLDVYSNNVTIGKPRMECCSTQTLTSIPTQEHYDDVVVYGKAAIKAEVCTPAPFCFVDKCGCCGEAVVFQGKFGSGARWFGHTNQCTTNTYLPYFSICCPISVMYGLAPGEADRIASIVNNQVEIFRNDQWAREPHVAAVMMGGHASAMVAPRLAKELA